MCKEARKMKRVARAEAGLCVECGSDEIVGSHTYCEKCWHSFTAFNILGTRTRSEDLKRLKDSEGRYICYLTGRELTEGEDLSFDHVIPKSRAPKTTTIIDNVRPCHSTVNRMKHTLTPFELEDLCKEILEHRGYRVERV